MRTIGEKSPSLVDSNIHLCLSVQIVGEISIVFFDQIHYLVIQLNGSNVPGFVIQGLTNETTTARAQHHNFSEVFQMIRQCRRQLIEIGRSRIVTACIDWTQTVPIKENCALFRNRFNGVQTKARSVAKWYGGTSYNCYQPEWA